MIDGHLDRQEFVALLVRKDEVVAAVGCQREDRTARLADRMRRPLPREEAMAILRAL